MVHKVDVLLLILLGESMKIKTDQFKVEGLTVLMFYSDQCPFCVTTKPKFEEIVPIFPTVKFNLIEFNDESLPLYSKFVPKQPVQTPVLKGGIPLLDSQDKPVMEWKMTPEGHIFAETPISIPSFFVFTNTPDNPQGEFLGKVDGNIDQLVNILGHMTQG